MKSVLLFLKQVFEQLPAVNARVWDWLRSYLEHLVASLSTFLRVRLLHQHALVISTVNLVAQQISVVLCCHTVVSFLHWLIHQLVLVHVLSESSIAA